MSLRVKTPLNGPRKRSPAVSSYFIEYMAGARGGEALKGVRLGCRGLPGGWGPFLSSCPVCRSRPQESVTHEPPEAEWVVSPPWSAAGLMLPWPAGHPKPCARSDRGKHHQLWNSTEKPNSSVWRRSRVEERRGLGGPGQDGGASVGMVPREERRGDCCVGFSYRQTDCTPERCYSGLLRAWGLPGPDTSWGGWGGGQPRTGQTWAWRHRHHTRGARGRTRLGGATPGKLCPGWVLGWWMDGPAETSEQNSGGLGSRMCRRPHLTLWELSGSPCLPPLSWAAVSSTQFPDVHSKSALQLIVWQRHLGTGRAWLHRQTWSVNKRHLHFWPRSQVPEMRGQSNVAETHLLKVGILGKGVSFHTFIISVHSEKTPTAIYWKQRVWVFFFQLLL